MKYFLLLCSILMGLLLPSLWAIEPSQEPVVQVVTKVKPTVVNIFTERMAEESSTGPADDFYDTFLGNGASRTVNTPIHNLGSGLLVSSDGYIVTNQHVVERASDLKIKVTLDDGSAYDAKMIREDLDTDLALIKIERPTPFPFHDIHHLSPNLLGQTVIAIGNPIGYESSVSKGILSAKNRSIKVDHVRMEGLLQTDAAINPGNSGGPLVDINGNLVGLNTVKMMTARQMNVENIGFAVPGDKIKEFVENAIAVAQGKRPAPPEIFPIEILKKRFGLQVQALDDQGAAALGYAEGAGLMIEKVESSSAAQEAGLKKGMMIVAVEGRRVRCIEDLPGTLARVKTGDDVRFTLLILDQQGPVLLQRVASIILSAHDTK